MDFADKLKDFCTRVKNIRGKIKTEEATKTSLIMPFFSLLGYDVFNPLEFVPEYTADVGIKKGEKVDYAIVDKKQNPLILIGKILWRKSRQARRATVSILRNNIGKIRHIDERHNLPILYRLGRAKQNGQDAVPSPQLVIAERRRYSVYTKV